VVDFLGDIAMLLKTISIASAAVMALSLGAAQAATTNGFANGGFETAGVTTPGAAWLVGAAGYTRSTDAHTGSFSAQLASPAFNAAVMLQNSKEQGGLPNLTVGDVPTLTFWAKGFAGGTGNVLFALRYLDDIGNIKANSGNQFFQGSINPNTWSQITFTLAGGVPAGATAAFIEFSQGIGPIDAGNPAGKVLIDDIYLGVAAAVPEPGTYGMLLAGLGVVGVIARRRRQV
jgi:PEP-CTERM motif